MRALGKVALVLSLLCVAFSAYVLAEPEVMKICLVGSSEGASDPYDGCGETNCGSAAFPGDVDGPSFQNCSGGPGGASASAALLGMGLAGLGLVVVAATSWRTAPRGRTGSGPPDDPSNEAGPGTQRRRGRGRRPTAPRGLPSAAG
jgi:hypothetical protein